MQWPIQNRSIEWMKWKCNSFTIQFLNKMRFCAPSASGDYWTHLEHHFVPHCGRISFCKIRSSVNGREKKGAILERCQIVHNVPRSRRIKRFRWIKLSDQLADNGRGLAGIFPWKFGIFDRINSFQLNLIQNLEKRPTLIRWRPKIIVRFFVRRQSVELDAWHPKIIGK